MLDPFDRKSSILCDFPWGLTNSKIPFLDKEIHLILTLVAVDY
jgi:hypothetical protein